MEIDFNLKKLSIGIRDFVTFGQNSYPITPMSRSGNWRTQLGQHWHQQLWQETQSISGDNAKSEVSISGNIPYQNWTFELSGRIDQLIIEADDIVLREVKTTQHVIPLPQTELIQIFPDYFEQLACYQILASSKPDWKDKKIFSELLMFHIETGIRQIVPIEFDPLDFLKIRFERWIDFLKGQKTRDDRIKHVVVPAAFEEFREDQIPVREGLFHQISELNKNAKQFITLQAATGFGKTSIAIEWALKTLQRNDFKRVIYVTGKNTGQHQVIQELDRFQQMAEGIRFFHIRNSQTHLQSCPHLHCPCANRQPKEPNLESFIPYQATQRLLKEGSPRMQTIAEYAGDYDLCPRLISQACLSHSEFWVADYNYIFSSGAQNVLESIPGYTPETTLLIVDEAHNLHERIAANHSTSIQSYQLNQLMGFLYESKAPQKLLSSVSGVKEFCDSLKATDRLDPHDEYELQDRLEMFQQTLNEHGNVLSKLPDAANEILWELGAALQVTKKTNLTYLYWVPKEGTIRLSCIDASNWIHEIILNYRKVLFMTATFPPMKAFEHQTNLRSSEIKSIEADSQWREQAYTVAIDCRVNTTYKRRRYSYTLTSETLAQLSNHSHQPILAFFPSYQYAETVAEYITVTYPHQRVLTLSKEYTAEEQIDILDRDLNAYNILCLPLGSGLSEGIDILGGRIDHIAIISPSLPEVNAIQTAKSEQFSRKRDAFHSNFLIPGLTKVNQALGRIVRKPEHKAKVLLHCERFAQADYKKLLSTEYQNATYIRTNLDFDRWLATP